MYRLVMRVVVVALLALGVGLAVPAGPASAGGCPPGWIGNPGEFC
jgi:hypothetical protein